MASDHCLDPSAATIVVGPSLSADQLFDFYERNNICEAGFGKEVAARVLAHPHVIVGALVGEELVGLARATVDGLSAAIMEFSLDVRWQGSGTNGSLMEGDAVGLGARLGRALLGELNQRGASFVTVYLVDGIEERFYETLGFGRNEGHSVYTIDARSYTLGGRLSEAGRG